MSPHSETSTVVSRLDARPLYETVYEALKERITEGALQAGDTLSEVQLAQMLSVSRTPVRDAIRRLVSENLLVVTARGAVRVYSPTAADLANVYCTRAALEGLASGLAAARADPAFCARLEAICDRGAATLQGDPVQSAARLNGEFHQAILERAGNDRICQLLANLQPVIVRYRHFSLTFPDHLTQSWSEHREIARLMGRANREEIEAKVRSHILKAGGRIVAVMKSIENTTVVTPSMELVLNA